MTICSGMRMKRRENDEEDEEEEQGWKKRVIASVLLSSLNLFCATFFSFHLHS